MCCVLFFAQEHEYILFQQINFNCNILKIVVCLFVLFLLAIVQSLLLRYEDSICPFGIFKLFLIKSSDLDIALLPISLPNSCKLSGIELKDISIQQELIFIEKDRICINMKYVFTIYRALGNNDISVIEDNTFNNLPNLQTL